MLKETRRRGEQAPSPFVQTHTTPVIKQASRVGEGLEVRQGFLLRT